MAYRLYVLFPGAVGAGAAIFGVVEPANAQLRSGSKRPTPKRVGSDRMPAKNFAPVVHALSSPYFTRVFDKTLFRDIAENCCYKNVHWIVYILIIYMLPIFRGIAPQAHLCRFPFDCDAHLLSAARVSPTLYPASSCPHSTNYVCVLDCSCRSPSSTTGAARARAPSTRARSLAIRTMRCAW